MKLSFKANEQEMFKNGLDCNEATLKSISSGAHIPETSTANLTKAAALTVSDVQSETSDTTTTTTTTTSTTTTTTTTANTLPPVTVTGTIPDSGGGGSTNVSVTLTPSQWNAATTTGSYKVSDLPFAAGDVTVIAQYNQSSGTYDFGYSQMIPPKYVDFMNQLDNNNLFTVPPPPPPNFAYILDFIECLLGGGHSNTNNNVALYKIKNNNDSDTGFFGVYSSNIAIDNDGDPTVDTNLDSSAQLKTSLLTGLSGQNNYLDGSQTNYIALGSHTMAAMGVKPGDYVAVTNNDPNNANYGQTFFGLVGDNSGETNKYIGEMSYNFAMQVFGTNAGITKYSTGNDDLNKVNIMIAAGSGDSQIIGFDDKHNPIYCLNQLFNDGVQATTQEDIQIVIENNGQAAFGVGAQGAGPLAPLFRNPPSGVLLTCTP